MVAHCSWNMYMCFTPSNYLGCTPYIQVCSKNWTFVPMETSQCLLIWNTPPKFKHKSFMGNQCQRWKQLYKEDMWTLASIPHIGPIFPHLNYLPIELGRTFWIQRLMIFLVFQVLWHPPLYFSDGRVDSNDANKYIFIRGIDCLPHEFS